MRSKPSTSISVLDAGNSLFLDKDVGNIRVDVEWTTKSLGIICDLDLAISLYNDRVRINDILSNICLENDLITRHNAGRVSLWKRLTQPTNTPWTTAAISCRILMSAMLAIYLWKRLRLI
jgi:hypothetical protein